MNTNGSNQIILTLDAGGTNFVFTALQQGNIIGESIHLAASTKDKISCTQTIIEGFELLKLGKDVKAISFAFPGPADYQNGIIGDLPNFPGINGNYPLKEILEEHFKIPVFINNDGNLFGYGEALDGVLPEINEGLKNAGSPKIFQNLIGITLGTGLGCGIVINKTLLNGDNSTSGEIHNMSNPNNHHWSIEESVSTRAIQRMYAEYANIEIDKSIMPEHIFKIATGERDGNKRAAIRAFQEYGKALGIVIGNVIALIDGIVVIGGGITAAWNLFSPALFDSINSKFKFTDGSTPNRTTPIVFNLEDKIQYQTFLEGTIEIIHEASLNSYIKYDSMQRTGIILSKKGASCSTSIGAYHFAISQLNNK